MAFELSLKEWKLAFATKLGDKPFLRKVSAGELAALQREIRSVKRRLALPKSVRYGFSLAGSPFR
jgi:hypothetical protein